MPADILKLLSAATPVAADAELVARFAAARDEAAFAELVRRHGPAVYRVCRRLAPTCAEDAFQATFLVLACRARAVRKAASVGSWLVGVAGRVTRQMAQKERRAGGVGQLVEPLDHRAVQPRRTPEAAELAAALNDELTRLPDRYRAPVVLCLVDGRTQEEAAAKLGGSIRTLRRRLDRAKALLRLRLERRGVVPAVAVGLVAGAGAAATVPPELARLAVRGAFDFLAGGAATSPAAVVAKGVVGGMANVKTTALVATAAAVLIGLGIGAAQQPPRVGPTPELPFPGSASPLKPADKPLLDLPAEPQNRPETTSFHRSSNFEVTAPTGVIARAVAAEAEYQREQLAQHWLGAPPAAWGHRCKIRVLLTGGAAGGATSFSFGINAAGKPSCGLALMKLDGNLENILSTALPHEVTHAVLAYHFGKPLPRWADEGISLLAEPRDEQVKHDELARKILNGGRGIRLRVLFQMREYPTDAASLYAQGHSVARFLYRYPATVAMELGEGAASLGQRRREQLNPPARLLEFLRLGTDGNTPESWDKAAKEVYAFASVDALEEAWLAWLVTEKSRLGVPQMPGHPKTANPKLIPPTALPGGNQPPAAFRFQNGYFTFATWKVVLPFSRGPDRRGEARNSTLFVSRDEGKTWERHSLVTPDATEYVYQASKDGVYWLDVMDGDVGERVKANPNHDFTPALKVLVDTTPPVVQLRASGKGVEWTATDANLDPASIKLQHKLPSWTEWRTVTDREMKATDRYAWAFRTGEAIQTRVLAKDMAGNDGVSAVVTVE